jgi:hypothetical protein
MTGIIIGGVFIVVIISLLIWNIYLHITTQRYPYFPASKDESERQKLFWG